MKIVFFGTPQFAVPSLQQLLAHPDFEVVAVITQPDKRRGRGNRVSASPVKAAALAAHCPIWQPTRLKKSVETLQNLHATQADAFVVVAYGQLLSPEILAIPRLGCINAHGSILPQYRGAAPIQWSLYHGEKETGVTTMQMDAGMDTGPMLLNQRLPIQLFDQAGKIAEQLSVISAMLLIETLQKLNQGCLEPTPQVESAATYAPLIQKADYQIDWQRSALAIHNQVRGFYPNCDTQFRGMPLKVLETIPLGEQFWPQLPADWQSPLQTAYETLSLESLSLTSQPGAVVGLIKGWGVAIATPHNPLLLKTVKPAGKQAQSGWDFANGNRLQRGEQLTS